MSPGICHRTGKRDSLRVRVDGLNRRRPLWTAGLSIDNATAWWRAERYVLPIRMCRRGLSVLLRSGYSVHVGGDVRGASATYMCEAMMAATAQADPDFILSAVRCDLATATVELVGDRGGQVAKRLPA